MVTWARLQASEDGDSDAHRHSDDAANDISCAHSYVTQQPRTAHHSSVGGGLGVCLLLKE